MRERLKPWCCEPGCTSIATLHVQGYHENVAPHDDYTHTCEAHLSSTLDFGNGEVPERGKATQPAEAWPL